MSQAKRMSAFLTLALMGCWSLGPAHAQGLEPVKKDAGAPAKAGKGQKADQSSQEAKKDPEAAARHLEAGIKAYGSGKLDQAIGSISMALQNGGLPSPSVARALYYRGAAYRKQGKPAQAIADLKSALWLKSGLSEAERSDAAAQHAAAYKEAGLGEAPAVERTVAQAPASTGTPAAPSSAPTISAPLPLASTPASSAPPMSLAPTSGETAAAAPAQSTGGGVAGFFSNLFGGGSSDTSAAAPAQTAAPVTTASTRPAEPEVSSWSSTTSVKPAPQAHAAPPPRTHIAAVEPAAVEPAPAKPATQAAPARKPSGKYRLEIGSTTSRDEAMGLAERLKAEHAHELASREPEIDEGKFGASRYYRVGVGPYANAEEPGRLCATLKAKGIDCLVVTR